MKCGWGLIVGVNTALYRMSSQTSSRGGGGGTMTWASSRRLVITNDVPQIVVANSVSPRSHDRCGAAFSPYSPRSGNSPNARGGFQNGRGSANANFQLRNMSAAQRGGGFLGICSAVGETLFLQEQVVTPGEEVQTWFQIVARLYR